MSQQVLQQNFTGHQPFNIIWYRQIPQTVYPFDASVFEKPRICFVAGDRDSGKGVFQEQLGRGYLERGSRIVDLWGAPDNEQLAWLRDSCPFSHKSKILLFHGPSVELTFDKRSYETKIASKVTAEDFETYDMILTSPRFFPLIDWSERYSEMSLLIRRLLTFRDHYRELTYVIAREASEILYSRMKAWSNIEEVKAQIIQMVNKCRHAGISMSVDTQRLLDVDKAMRDASDFKIFKRLDYNWFPYDIKWASRYIREEKMVALRPNQFVIIARDGSTGEGTVEYVPWHKQEKEDLLGELGIHVFYKEAPIPDELKGGIITIGDVTHSEIIRLRLEEHLSITVIKNIFDKKYADMGLHTRISHETLGRHLKWHQIDIENSKICQRCRRASSKLALVPIREDLDKLNSETENSVSK